MPLHQGGGAAVNGSGAREERSRCRFPCSTSASEPPAALPSYAVSAVPSGSARPRRAAGTAGSSGLAGAGRALGVAGASPPERCLPPVVRARPVARRCAGRSLQVFARQQMTRGTELHLSTDRLRRPCPSVSVEAVRGCTPGTRLGEEGHPGSDRCECLFGWCPNCPFGAQQESIVVSVSNGCCRLLLPLFGADACACCRNTSCAAVRAPCGDPQWLRDGVAALPPSTEVFLLIVLLEAWKLGNL